MIQLSIQLFGGRGAVVGVSKKNAGLPRIRKRTATEISGMTRKQTISAAKQVYIRNNMQKGLSRNEAEYRFNALVDGNTTAQLKKYIKRYQ